MSQQEMIDALVKTGAYLKQHVHSLPSGEAEFREINHLFYDEFEALISSEHIYNPWFTEENIRKSIAAIAETFSKESLETWLKEYPTLPVNSNNAKKVGVVMAGNIPLVGMHDLLSVLMSGHYFLGKPSSKDDHLIRFIGKLLSSIEPGFADRIVFTDEYLKGIDAIIATGSNNTSRYFEYYFNKIPHIIRKNRNGIAVLSGNESHEDLQLLGEDIFSYFGLGCRNVTKLYIPEDFQLEKILYALESFTSLSQHTKYMNNIDYNRSVYLMNLLPFLDNGLILVREEEQISSPVGVVYYEKYSQLDKVKAQLKSERDQIQCIVTQLEGFENSVSPGMSQSPMLWEYADGVDTMKFLAELGQ